jgi:hypothetical protein
MSILHFRFGNQLRDDSRAFPHEADSLYERDALGDLKHGLDLIFSLKTELDKLHPIAADTLIRLLSN